MRKPGEHKSTSAVIAVSTDEKHPNITYVSQHVCGSYPADLIEIL